MRMSEIEHLLVQTQAELQETRRLLNLARDEHERIDHFFGRFVSVRRAFHDCKTFEFVFAVPQSDFAPPDVRLSPADLERVACVGHLRGLGLRSLLCGTAEQRDAAIKGEP